MTFTPEALPIGFNSGVRVRLCFGISSETTAAKSGNRQPGRPAQRWGPSWLAPGGRGRGQGGAGLWG